MRTTLDIDDDIYFYSREAAQAQRMSLGKTISQLLRERIQAPQNFVTPVVKNQNNMPDPMNTHAPDADGFMYRNGFAILPANGRVVSTETIRKIMDEEGI